MKLWYSKSSPFVRKVRMTAIEIGVDGRIELVAAGMPLGPAGAIAEKTPLGKIPTLMTDDGMTLIDSPLICEYLDSLHDGPALIPAHGPDRWRVLALAAMADGVMDAGVLRIMESRRPEDERSPAWVEKQTAVCRQGLDALEHAADGFGEAPDMAQITICCALGWLEFRSIEPDWRDSRPALADWYAGFSARSSALATEPSD